MNALAELKAAGEKATQIEYALRKLKDAEWKLDLVNKHAKNNAGKAWTVELALEKRDSWSYDRAAKVDVHIPYEYVVRQVINEVIEARRQVVLAGGEVPTASEQVQRRGAP